MKLLLIISVFPGLMVSIRAQDPIPCPCCTENHKLFDFWVGEWNVYDTLEQLVGTNNIVELQDGCTIQENWNSAKSNYSGTSYNYFNSTDSTWNQVWIDNQGGILELKGNFRDSKMILKSDLLQGSKQMFRHRITWTDNKDGTVRQVWENLGEDGQRIGLLFNGLYVPCED